MNKDNFKKRVGLILAGLGISNIGEWVYFIALNLMILASHGTAWSVGVLYLIRPIADMLTNAVFSSFIDKLNKRRWLFSLDFTRAVLVASLIWNQNLLYIYIVVFLIQVANSIHEPISVSYAALAIPAERQKKFNSWQSLVNSGGFLLGPAIAGYLLTIGSPNFAIFIYALSLVISGIIKFMLPDFIRSFFHQYRLSDLRSD